MKAPMSAERAPKSRREIERLVLLELQTADGCAGARGISIVGWDNPPAVDAPNWTVASFACGAADDYDCERELIGIVARLQGCYQLVQKH
jgi:hypothetical protein